MFVDEIELTIEGGKGGDGKVAFFPFKQGPCGGDGGQGGSVYVLADSDMNLLNQYAGKELFKAEDGEAGEKNRKMGARGNDLILSLPVGTILTDLDTGEQLELSEAGKQFLISRGGEGGRGNDSFKSSINQTPRQSTPGLPGERRRVNIILKLSADFGLIGLPNAGKSSILNALTAAHVKTANYPFTTLEPYLGTFQGKIIADVPGLIEGASKGRGLGIKFLKHIEKVSALLHCISAESSNLKKDYTLIVNELTQYNPELIKKKSILLLTKSDLASEKELNSKIKILKKINSDVIAISIYNPDSLKALKKLLSGIN